MRPNGGLAELSSLPDVARKFKRVVKQNLGCTVLYMGDSVADALGLRCGSRCAGTISARHLFTPLFCGLESSHPEMVKNAGGCVLPVTPRHSVGGT